jgi:hypothetical protein
VLFFCHVVCANRVQDMDTLCYNTTIVLCYHGSILDNLDVLSDGLEKIISGCVLCCKLA